MYDFHTLSPVDFELLIRDLLQAQLGVTMESFGPGKDGGVDFRFATAGQDVVVQAKHLVEGGARSLVRAAKKEDVKVRKLAPTRYILVTSLSLTPDLKRKVIQAMPSTPLSAEDVIGREDLNNYLGLHPHVLRQHFKLWLTSADVLDRILHSAAYNRTDAELARIKHLVPKFVHNSSVTDAEKVLKERGALIIAGEPGVGKTTLGRMLLWLHMEQNWKVFVVDDLQEAMAVSTAGERRLIFLDDFLGQISLTNQLLGQVDQRLPVFLDRLRNNKELRFVLTTRQYLLNQAQIQSDKLSSPRVVASEMILNVGVYTRAIKAKVVFNHIYFSDLVDEEKAKLLGGDFFLKMIDHRNFSPRLIELLTSADYYAVGDESIRATVLRVLDNPSELWDRPYRSHVSADARCLLWAIFFAGSYAGMDGCLQLFKGVSLNSGHQIPQSDAVARFRTALKELSGSFVIVTNQVLSLANPGIRDYLSRVVIDDHLLPVVIRSVSTLFQLRSVWNFFTANIKVCRDQFDHSRLWTDALDRIHTHSSTTAMASLRQILEICRSLPEVDVRAALDRAVEDLKTQGIESSDHHDCWFALMDMKVLRHRTDGVLNSAFEALTDAAAELLSNAGANLRIEDIKSIAEALEPLTDQGLVRNAAGDALRGFIRDIEYRLDEISSSQELESFRTELLSAARSYGVGIESAREEDFRVRFEELKVREDEEAVDPYQHAAPPDLARSISDDEIRSMFSMMTSAGSRPQY